jgi:hypothetical protein
MGVYNISCSILSQKCFFFGLSIADINIRVVTQCHDLWTIAYPFVLGSSAFWVGNYRSLALPLISSVALVMLM